MSSIRKLMRVLVVLACAGLVLGAESAVADPPARVARLAYIQGPVSFAPAGEDDWVVAEINRPLIAGDRLYTDVGARTELQIGSSAIRLGASTSATLLNMDDQIAQLQLTEGSVYVNARRLDPSQTIEIDTPNLALSIIRPGTYRIDVDASGDSTGVAVRRGQADVYGEGAAYTISSGQSYRFFATGLEQREYAALPPPDAFDQWAASRDQRYDAVAVARYVAPEMVGYEDLDQYGTWSNVPEYGNVWFPRRVAADWAPYRDGRWTWIDPWGWTWVDTEPWGFAPYHYGRWAYVRDRWCWVPGPRTVRPVYAPALVAFVGGDNFSLTVSSGPAVAWFPLGPGEVYRPAYRVSHDYFTRVNVANTAVNPTIVNNVYNNNATSVVYRYRENPRAVTAVPRNVFAESRLVTQSKLGVASVDLSRLRAAPIATAPAVAPTRTAVIGAAQSAQHRPSDQAIRREVVAKTRPAPVPASFETREQALAKQPGRPLEPGAASSAGQRAEERRVRVVQAERRPEPAPKQSTVPVPAAKGQPPATAQSGAPGTAGRPEAAKTQEEPPRSAREPAQQAAQRQQEQRAQQQEQQGAQQAARQQQQEQRAQQQEQQKAAQQTARQQQEQQRAQQAARQQQEQRAQQQEQQKAAQQTARQQQEQQRAQQAARQQQQEQRAQQQEQQRVQQAARQQQEQQRAQQAARQQQEQQQRAQQAARQQQEQQKAAQQQAARQQQEQQRSQQARRQQQEEQKAVQQQAARQQQEQQKAAQQQAARQQQEQQKAQQQAQQAARQQQEQQRAQQEQQRAREAQQSKGKEKEKEEDKQAKG
jgi:hypothetical protein